MLIEEVSSEKCPVCGEFYRYRSVPELNITMPRFCKCENEKIEKDRAEEVAAGTASIRSGMRKLSGIPKKYQAARLENISPAKGQENAYKEACAFVKRFNKSRNTSGIYFIGVVGSGKTYISAAIANAIISSWPIPECAAKEAVYGNFREGFSPVRFTSTVDLFTQLKSAYSKNATGKDILDELENVPLLILDDLGAETISTWARDRLFEIINHRYNEERPVVITTNLQADDLKIALGERTCDRIREMCVFAPVTATSQRKEAAFCN